MTLSVVTTAAHVVNASATTSVTFTPAANSLVGVFCGGDAGDGSTDEALTVASTGHTMTSQGRSNGGVGGTMELWTTPITSSASMTVNVTDNKGSKPKAVKVVWWTDSSGSTPGVGAVATGNAGQKQLDVTSTASGSWAWGWVFGTANFTTQTGQTLQDHVDTADSWDGGDTAGLYSLDAKSTASGQTMEIVGSSISTIQFLVAEIVPPAGGGSSDATVTPSVVAATTAVGTVSLRTDEKTTPSTVAGVAAVGTVSVHGGANPVASTVAGTATVGTVTVKTGSTAAPANVAGTAAVGTVTVKAVTNTTPATVAATATVGSPTVKTGSTVTVGTVAAAASVPPPSVTAGGSATASPSTVAAVATVGTVTEHAGQTVTVSTVAGVASIGAAAAKTGSTAAPTTVALRASVDVPTVTATSASGLQGGRLGLATTGARVQSATVGGIRSATSSGRLNSGSQ